MDESDEDIDPLVGPIADLMAEHNLSTTTTTTTTANVNKPVEIIEIPEQRINILNYLSFLNLRLLFKDIFNYFLDIQWFSYLKKSSPKLEQEIFLQSTQLYSSIKLLSLLFIVRISFSSFSPQLFSNI